MDDALAHIFEDRLRPRERLVRTAAHEGERSAARSADPARNRRVEGKHARGVARLVRFAGAVDIDGRAIDNDGAFCRRGEEFRMSRQHVTSGREHGYDRVGARDGLAGARRNGDARCGRRGLRGIDKIEAGDRMTRLDEIGGHRRAHVAEADECDSGHGSSGRLQGSAQAMLKREQVEAIISRPTVNPVTKRQRANLCLWSTLSNNLSA